MNLQFPSFIQADSLSLSIFAALLVYMLCLCLYFTVRADSVLRRAPTRLIGLPQLICVSLLLLFSLIVASGLPARYPIPVIPLLFVSVMGVSCWIAWSSYGAAMARAVSFPLLIGFQGFRLPLELILHQWAAIGTIPTTMTWSGQNIDIISGIAAFLFTPLVGQRPFLAWIPTLIGFALLVNVIHVVVMSSPFPFSWPLEQPLQLILHLPYALIVPLCVAPALVGHLIALRALLRRDVS